jgi:hypothetical protein
MAKRIPVSSLADLAKSQKLTHAVLLGFDQSDNRNYFVTWGATVEACSQAADMGNKLAEFMGFPDLQLEPARVKVLLKENKALKAELELLKGKAP